MEYLNDLTAKADLFLKTLTGNDDRYIGVDSVGKVKIMPPPTGTPVPDNVFYVSPAFSQANAPYYSNLTDAVNAMWQVPSTEPVTLIIYSGVYNEPIVIERPCHIYCFGARLTNTFSIQRNAEVFGGVFEDLEVEGDIVEYVFVSCNEIEFFRQEASICNTTLYCNVISDTLRIEGGFCNVYITKSDRIVVTGATAKLNINGTQIREVYGTGSGFMYLYDCRISSITIEQEFRLRMFNCEVICDSDTITYAFDAASDVFEIKLVNCLIRHNRQGSMRVYGVNNFWIINTNLVSQTSYCIENSSSQTVDVYCRGQVTSNKPVGARISLPINPIAVAPEYDKEY